MIYKQKANLPYPVLSLDNDSYTSNYFVLDADLYDDVDHFYFKIKYELESDFINSLLRDGKAQLILIVQSRDSKFYRISRECSKVKIPKNRLSVNNRLEVQLHIQANEDISFKNNDDLNDFYQGYKDQIKVSRYSLLGYSNIVTYNGQIRKPFELFEKRYKEDLKSDINISLGSETIIIEYKDRDILFEGLPGANALITPYIYLGLSKALFKFIDNNTEYGNDEVELDFMEEPADLLDLKLYHLMKSKGVEVLNLDNIDEVIYKVSDRMIEKFVKAVRRLESNGD